MVGRLAGVVLYESAPAADAEQFAEADRNLTEFVRRNVDHPGAADVLEAWRSVPTVASDEAFTAVARRLLPAYFADYWGRTGEFVGFAAAVAGTYISGLDEHGAPDTVDDRAVLGSIDVPTLVLVGRHDFICGLRWGRRTRGSGWRGCHLGTAGDQVAEMAAGVVGQVGGFAHDPGDQPARDTLLAVPAGRLTWRRRRCLAACRHSQ